MTSDSEQPDTEQSKGHSAAPLAGAACGDKAVEAARERVTFEWLKESDPSAAAVANEFWRAAREEWDGLAAPIEQAIARRAAAVTDTQIIAAFKRNGVISVPSRSIHDPDGLAVMVAVARDILARIAKGQA